MGPIARRWPGARISFPCEKVGVSRIGLRAPDSPTPLVATALAAAALVLPAASGAAQTNPGPDTRPETAARCDGATFRQFDFWIGEWEVRNPAGEIVGHNEIRRVARGCGLLERWRGADGSRGTSVNTYDASRKKWTQRWVGDGAALWLEGGMEDGSMVLSGTSPRSTPRGPVLDRISWTALPDGRVRQLWEVSADGGKTWQAAFEGLYRKLAQDPRRPARCPPSTRRKTPVQVVSACFASPPVRSIHERNAGFAAASEIPAPPGARKVRSCARSALVAPAAGRSPAWRPPRPRSRRPPREAHPRGRVFGGEVREAERA